MRPKKPKKASHDDFFLVRLDQLINRRHELALLADRIDWDWIDDEIAPLFSDQGCPAEPARFMIGMFLLKATYNQPDEQVWDRWVSDPCCQYFTGEEFFQHQLPHGALVCLTGANASATNSIFCWPKACASPMTVVL